MSTNEKLFDEMSQKPSRNAPTQLDSRIGLHNKSQRRINLMWESTQALIAMGVVAANIAILFLVTPGGPAKEAMMSNAFFLVIGFYFGRTNHLKVGGLAHPRGADIDFPDHQ